MRYLIPGLVASLILFVTFIVLPFTNETSDQLLFLYIDIGLVVVFIHQYLKYWSHAKKGLMRQLKLVLVIHIGIGFVGLGTSMVYSDDYFMAGTYSRAALIRDINNILGNELHPLIPAWIWILSGVWIIYFAVKKLLD